MNDENKKITYKNMAKLDFRYLTDKSQISNIEEISNIGLILYPKNSDVQLLGALLSIPKYNIGYEYYLDSDDDIIIRNGAGVLYLSELNYVDKNIIVMLNGDFDVIDKGSELKSEYHFIINGVVKMNDKAFMNKNIYVDEVNGKLKRGNFDTINYFNGKKIEKKYIEELPNKTLLVLGKGYNSKKNLLTTNPLLRIY